MHIVMAGLPLSSWLLIGASVGAGLVLEIAFYRAHRQRTVCDDERAP